MKRVWQKNPGYRHTEAAYPHPNAAYNHSAYWYAKNYGWTHSEARSYTASYWDMHTYHPRKTSAISRLMGFDQLPELDSDFNPFLFAGCLMVDIGVSLRESCRRWATPEERAERRRELTRTLRILRRPFYYARETERRRQLAIERRKLHRRRTTAPMPSPEDILTAWRKRKESKENMILLGGLLHDLECYVDNCLRFNENGDVVGRNGGICGWLKANLPELALKYKTLMRYKAMAIKLRQATDTRDPKPTAALLKKPRPKLVETILSDPMPTFASLERAVLHSIDPSFTAVETIPDGQDRGAPMHEEDNRGRSLHSSRSR